MPRPPPAPHPHTHTHTHTHQHTQSNLIPTHSIRMPYPPIIRPPINLDGSHLASFSQPISCFAEQTPSLALYLFVRGKPSCEIQWILSAIPDNALVILIGPELLSAMWTHLMVMIHEAKSLFVILLVEEDRTRWNLPDLSRLGTAPASRPRSIFVASRRRSSSAPHRL